MLIKINKSMEGFLVIFLRIVGSGSIALAWYIIAYIYSESKVAEFARVHSQIMFYLPLMILGRDLIFYRESTALGRLSVDKSIILSPIIVFALLYFFIDDANINILIVSFILSICLTLSEGFRINDTILHFTFYKFVAFNLVFVLSLFIFLVLNPIWNFDFNLLALVGTGALFYLWYVVKDELVDFKRRFSIANQLSGVKVYLSQASSSIIIFVIYNRLEFPDEGLGQFALGMSLLSVFSMLQSSVYTRYTNQVVLLKGSALRKLYFYLIKSVVIVSLFFLALIWVVILTLDHFSLMPLSLSIDLYLLIGSQFFNILVGPSFIFLNLKGVESYSLLCSLLALLSLFIVLQWLYLSPNLVYAVFVVVLNMLGLLALLLNRKKLF